MEAVRQGAGSGAQLLKGQGVQRILVEGLGHPEQAAEGSALALWRYQEMRCKEKQEIVPTLELFDDPDTDSFQRGLFKAECQNLARRLADTPSNIMTPLQFAQETVNELCPCGLKVDVHDRDWIEYKRMQAFLTVARGSCEPPVMLEISYCGGPPDQKPIMIVGKGVTYDSGGLCLRKCKRQYRQRAAPGGAAAIIGAMKGVAALSLPVNIQVILPILNSVTITRFIKKPLNIFFCVSFMNISEASGSFETFFTVSRAPQSFSEALKPFGTFGKLSEVSGIIASESFIKFT